MCGISGFTHNRPPDNVEPIISDMASILSHRGPDYQYVYHDNEVALGHSRLSIIDLKQEANQPMCSADGRYVIVYNGEVYNFNELKHELSQYNIQFKSQSDTEVVLEMCAKYGVEKAVSRFNGMFAFAIWDKKNKKLSLVRDRLGVKPLYYAIIDKNIIFSSELEPIAKYYKNKIIDIDSLSSFLKYGYIPAPKTIFKNIYKLPAGSILSYRSNEYSIENYWDVSDIWSNSVIDKNDYETIEYNLIELIENSVSARLVSDVPVGAFLSGGIDSALICAIMQKISKDNINTYTMGFEDSQYNEAPQAKLIADYLGTKHHEMMVREQDVLDVIPDLPAIYGEPFADSSQIPTTLLSRLTRNHVKVALSGDGGDETFLGYNRYIWGKKLWELNTKYPKMATNILKGITGVLSVNSWDRISSIMPKSPRHLGLQIARANSVLTIRNNVEFYNKIQNQWHAPENILNHHCNTQLDNDTFVSKMDIIEYMQLSDIRRYLPDDILVKVDRASMSVGLEVRVPLLDYRIVEYSRRIPEKYKIGNAKGKLILQNILRKYIPEKLWDRPKKGFNVPLERWLRGPLKEWAEHLLSNESLQQNNLFNPTPIRHAWEQQQNGSANNSGQLWTVLMFQAWIEHNKKTGVLSI